MKRTTIDDVVDSGECVDEDRVPCPKAVKYLKKKGLICGVGPPRPKPTPARKSSNALDSMISRLQNRVEGIAVEKILKEWLG
jgi:hypothetical protein